MEKIQDKKRKPKRLIKDELYKIQGRRCAICGKKFEKHELQIHHIIPKSFNGFDGSKNMVLLCASCHRQLHKYLDKRIYDFINKYIGIKKFFEKATKEFRRVKLKEMKKEIRSKEPLVESIFR